MARILITSALPYINGVKHLGNLVGSMLPADVYARHLRARGEEVLYICATDEHGTPAELAAEWARRPRKGEFVVMIGPAGDGQGVETAMGTEAGCGEADDTRELAGADGAEEDE